MRDLSERVLRLRDKAVNWRRHKYYFAGQVMYSKLKAMTELPFSMPVIKREAAILARTITDSAPMFGDDDVIVGYNFSEFNHFELLWGEMNEAWKQRVKDYCEQGVLPDDKKRFIYDTLDNIKAYMPLMQNTVPERPAEVALAEKYAIARVHGTPAYHTVIDYEKVLREGFDAIREDIAQRCEALDRLDIQNAEKLLLYESCLTLLDAACGFGKAYSALAREKAGACEDEARRAELAELADICDQVPARPARTFREALQSFWFVHIINTWEDGIEANCPGRLDRILYPFYKADIDAGRISRDDAFELLCHLWIKLYRDYDVQQTVLSGLTKDGRDATNELTWLMLDVTDALDYIRCVSVRVNRHTPDALLERCFEIVRKGQGIPFFFNDEVIIPALERGGIPFEDAYDYTPLGCVEITIPGKANPHAVSNRVILLKCLELALNNGATLTSGVQIGPQTGYFNDMKSFDELMDAYRQQVAHAVKVACFESNRQELYNSYARPMVLKSILTEGCIESGRHFNRGGAKYNYHESMPMAIPNTADALCAVRQLVFEEKKYTPSQMIELLRGNFEDEAVRLEFVNRVPKYGNDIDAVDLLAAEITQQYIDELAKHKSTFGGPFYAQPFTYLWFEEGRRVAATPDGRRAGENIAYSISPSTGRDGNGLTAVFNSLAKLPNDRAAGGTSAIIETDPDLFDRMGTKWMAAALKTAFQKGVGQLQFNVVKAETLIEAQQDRGKYPNLAVRVAGFSQKFVLLSKEVQDHIIARTKHKKA